jgi:hypothetical protein
MVPPRSQVTLGTSILAPALLGRLLNNPGLVNCRDGVSPPPMTCQRRPVTKTRYEWHRPLACVGQPPPAVHLSYPHSLQPAPSPHRRGDPPGRLIRIIRRAAKTWWHRLASTGQDPVLRLFIFYLFYLYISIPCRKTPPSSPIQRASVASETWLAAPLPLSIFINNINNLPR